MIYRHHEKAIDYITEKFYADSNIDALLISGSLSHGFNSENSDVDINIVVSEEFYAAKADAKDLAYWENARDFYEGGYFDGKYITLSYLSLVAERGNEPTRFALADAQIAFDRTGKVHTLLRDIGVYDTSDLYGRTIRFLSQLDAWKWYCGEAAKRGDDYLLDLSVTKLILFAGRLILLENRTFFPYHKWFLRVLEEAPKKPPELMPAIRQLMRDKSPDNVNRLYDIVLSHKDWAEGKKYSWPANFIHDTETLWMRHEDFIENI